MLPQGHLCDDMRTLRGVQSHTLVYAEKKSNKSINVSSESNEAWCLACSPHADQYLRFFKYPSYMLSSLHSLHCNDTSIPF